MFAKLFETEKYGQILVKRDSNDEDRAEVRFYFQPAGDSLGVCSLALTFDASDEGDQKADKAFGNITEDLAIQLVDQVMSDVEPIQQGID